MKALFTYLTGGRSGQAVAVEKSYALLGRAPQADVRFGPDHDLVVSARHAAVVYRGGAWILRDLASTNGTFVNGIEVQGEQKLADQDLIRLGDGGPIVRFGILSEGWTAPVSGAEPEPPADQPPADQEMAIAPTTAVPRTPIAVPFDEPMAAMPTPGSSGKRGGFLRMLAAVGALAVIAVLIAQIVGRESAPAAPVDNERSRLIARADSLYAALEDMRGSELLLGIALTGAKAQTARLRSRIRRATLSPAVLQPLRDTLDQLMNDQARLAAAAALDVAGIARSHDLAVVVLLATYADGSMRTAAAFAAERRGRTVLVTTRAVTLDAEGRPASLAVLPRSGGEPRATRVITANSRLDLALLEAPAGTGFGAPPRLAARKDTVVIGQVAVMLGFPENLARSADASPLPRTVPTAALGSVALAAGNELELQPFGSTLAPGTPVFDNRGTMIGVVLGYSKDPQRLRALPATAVARFLAEGAGAS